jgi:hypothetical protein
LRGEFSVFEKNGPLYKPPDTVLNPAQVEYRVTTGYRPTSCDSKVEEDATVSQKRSDVGAEDEKPVLR